MNARKSNKQEQITAAFTVTVVKMKDRLEVLQQYAENSMDFDLKGIDWSHVGSAACFLRILTQLTDMVAYERDGTKQEKVA